ncbi:hypothetical protein ACFQHV_02460 [Promicromonospora thailandica]|uniref:Uncharacterized protein n=1 Tax=Promicromonospora thailandica TaxID=765201 RepID=A0A9X2JX69_9MICO|nr:hypothetical protein [Promicromonospora thailandica]MCP2266926.1 hypothetical protein [Promicromonospora thailandica]BFF16806.1 hypothetical protein GCM10025730_03270 [Promicromonospora thailandica]
MYETSEGQVPGGRVASPVEAAFAALVDELVAGSRVTYAPATERAVHYAGHAHGAPRRHRRFVLRAGTDLDDPR